MEIAPEHILDFWFADTVLDAGSIGRRNEVWFGMNPAFDAEIKSRFESVLLKASTGELKSWENSIEGILALIILQDQFPRNIYRDTEKAFAFDQKALRLALRAIHDNSDKTLPLLQRVFIYLPLEHAEDLETQDLSVMKYRALVAESPMELRKLFESFLNYAVMHQEIVKRFGRFPHRNAVLKRESSEEEKAYLNSGGVTFGQTA